MVRGFVFQEVPVSVLTIFGAAKAVARYHRVMSSGTSDRHLAVVYCCIANHVDINRDASTETSLGRGRKV